MMTQHKSCKHEVCSFYGHKLRSPSHHLHTHIPDPYAGGGPGGPAEPGGPRGPGRPNPGGPGWPGEPTGPGGPTMDSPLGPCRII